MDHNTSRHNMIEQQLSARGIKDPRVIDAFRDVPRHIFVPATFGENAYDDTPVSIGNGQTISQPYMVALMTEKLCLAGNETVLEIGTGSGYQTAILAGLCEKVITVERDLELLKRAEKVLLTEGYKNIEFIHGDGTLGALEFSPFERIMVTAAAPYVPETLKDQLADPGRIVIPVGERALQFLLVIEKRGSEYSTEEICGCVFVPLRGQYGWKE